MRRLFTKGRHIQVVKQRPKNFLVSVYLIFHQISSPGYLGSNAGLA